MTLRLSVYSNLWFMRIANAIVGTTWGFGADATLARWYGSPTAFRGVSEELVAVSGSDSSVVESEAEKIEQALQATLDRNYRFTNPWSAVSTEHRRKGYYCHEWAYAFAVAVNEKVERGSSDAFFTAEVQHNYAVGNRGLHHAWVAIRSSTGETIFVDDGFMTRGYVHAAPPKFKGAQSSAVLAGMPTATTPSESLVPYAR